jgi:hypothetical protein
MKREPKKTAKSGVEDQLLALLKQVLPKATDDARLADKIFEAVEQELGQKSRSKAFDKFCARCPLTDLEADSIKAVQQDLAAAFGGGDVTVKPNRKEGCLAVEVALPDGSQFSSVIKVDPSADKAAAESEAPAAKFAPFPVCLPGDAELVWLLAKRENLGPDKAAMALIRVEEEFWASKTGQTLLRDRVEKSFPEFIARAPAGLLTEAGLKRHYKEPEPIKLLRPLGKGRKQSR